MQLPPRGANDPLWVRRPFVGPDFFATFDAPIVSGRGFTPALGAPEVASGGGTMVGIIATAAIALFIAGVTALACLLPARRVLRIPPTGAPREA